jgi:methionine-rich copper-binding protein CopC
MNFFRLFCILFFYLTNISLIQAHAVITYSSLNVNSVIAGQVTQVELSFNSKVELNLSQILLVSTGDKTQILNAKPGNKPGFILIDLPPITPGEYAIQLKIFAADGHLSEDLLRFTVTEINR